MIRLKKRTSGRVAGGEGVGIGGIQVPIANKDTGMDWISLDRVYRKGLASRTG